MTKKESLDDDSSKHDKSAANLNFSRFGSRKKGSYTIDLHAFGTLCERTYPSMSSFWLPA